MMTGDDESRRRIMDDLSPNRVASWTSALKGFAPKSNKQMRLYARDFPEKSEVFRDILSFFRKFGDDASEDRLVLTIRSVQEQLGHVNFNMVKLAAIKQYMKFREQQE